MNGNDFGFDSGFDLENEVADGVNPRLNGLDQLAQRLLPVHGSVSNAYSHALWCELYCKCGFGREKKKSISGALGESS